MFFLGSRDKDSYSVEPNKAILERLGSEMLQILNFQSKLSRKKPEVSITRIPTDDTKVCEDSEAYAVMHLKPSPACEIDI